MAALSEAPVSDTLHPNSDLGPGKTGKSSTLIVASFADCNLMDLPSIE